MLKPVDDAFAAACVASVDSVAEAQRRMAEVHPRRPSLQPSLTAAEVMRARQMFREGVNLATVAFRLGVKPGTVRRGTVGLEW